MLDVSPSIAADILGDRLPRRVARSYRRFRHGPGAFKVDFAVDGRRSVDGAGGPPSRHGPSRRRSATRSSPTSERCTAGRCPSGRSCSSASSISPTRPGRSATSTRCGRTRTCPTAYAGDATEAIIAQIERFAPGFRERIVGTAVRSDDGDVGVQPELRRWRRHRRVVLAGAAPVPATIRRRPVLHRHPRGTYLCSASTPPGAGAHGMCGANAAARALARLGATVETSSRFGRESG